MCSKGVDKVLTVISGYYILVSMLFWHLFSTLGKQKDVSVFPREGQNLSYYRLFFTVRGLG